MPTAAPAAPAPPSAVPARRVRVWDLPTRLFHWVLAATLLGSVVSAKVGGAAMVWHFRLGYLVLALLAFRLVWGLVGGHWSRFHRFLYSPATVWRYLRGQERPGEHLDVGHSPLGALSVFALLGLLMVQVGTGLVADDEIANIGPLNRFVDGATAASATAWHKEWGQWLLLALVGLHVAAVAFYTAVRHKPLLAAMWHGDKHWPTEASAGAPPSSLDGLPQRLLALAVAVAAGAGAAWVASLAF
jgi:cytochrome b